MVVTAPDSTKLQAITNQALSIIAEWGRSVKLTFGPTKTQLISFTPKAKTARIVMDGHVLSFSHHIKFLGVILDEKLLFREHVRYITDKAVKIFSKLCTYTRPTWGAHPDNVRTIYRHVVEPTITYAAGIWGQVADKKYVQKTLLSVQRGFAIRAIRGFRTVSTVAAIALAGFVPLDIRVLEVHDREQTMLSGETTFLPSDVSLEKPTLIRDLLHPAERVSVNLRSSLSSSTDAGSGEAAAACIYTDGSKQEDGATGCAFVEHSSAPDSEPHRFVRKFKLHHSCTVFQAELFALLRACERAAEKRYPHTIIYTDSLSSLHAIANRSNTHPLVTQIHHILHRIRHTSTIAFKWVRGHSGVSGNEEADREANSATRLHRTPDYLHFPMSFVKSKIRERSYGLWRTRYESAEQGQHTKRLLPTLDDIRELAKHMKTSFQMTQLLTGHGFHKSYLKRFHITDDDCCPCDGSTPQTLDHLLRDCPAFGTDRLHYEETCRFLGVPPYNLPGMMSKSAAIDSFVGYVTRMINRLKEFNAA